MPTFRTRAFATGTLALFAGVLQAQVAPPPQTAIAFTNVNVIPMDREQVLENHTVIVRNGRIERVGPSASTRVPSDVQTVNASGKYLMPGLAEFHAHVPNGNTPQAIIDRVLTLYVVNGVATARSMLGDPSHLTMRDRIARGEQLGPRMIASGPSFNGNSVPTPADAVRMVTEQKNAGYDLLKIHPGLSREAYDSLVASARRVGIPYAGHVPLSVGWQHATATGYSTIDHNDGLLEALARTSGPLTPQQAGFFGLGLINDLDESKIPTVVQQARDAKVWLVPTAVLLDNYASDVTGDAIAAYPEMKYWLPNQVAQWALNKNNILASQQISADARNRFIDVRRRALLALHRGGVGILLGSDAPQLWNVPGFSAHRELDALVAAGLTPFEALQTGTINVARFLGETETAGTIAPGKNADLLLLDANPLTNIGNTKRIFGVMVQGRWLSNQEIQRKLAELSS